MIFGSEDAWLWYAVSGSLGPEISGLTAQRDPGGSSMGSEAFDTVANSLSASWSLGTLETSATLHVRDVAFSTEILFRKLDGLIMVE